MPVALDRSDRKLLIAAIALMLVLVATSAVLAPPEPAPAPVASSFSPGPTGAKAAYLLLGELGYRVERWSQPLSELPLSEGVIPLTIHDIGKSSGNNPQGPPAENQCQTPATASEYPVTLVLADPGTGGMGDEDLDQLESFVRHGGRVLLTGATGAEILSSKELALTKLFDAVTSQYHAVAVSPITQGAPVITMAATIRWNQSQPKKAERWHLISSCSVPLYGEGSNIVAISYGLGRGQVIWWASSMPLTNMGIEQTGNLRLLLNSLGPANGTRVLWDEYYHGERRTLTSYLAGTPAAWMLLQAGIIYFLLLLAYGRRTGPLRKATVESRLSPLEFVETLGALYQSAGAASSAVETVWQRFRYLVGTRLGLPASASVKQMFESARDRLGWSEPGLYEALQRAERASKSTGLSDKEALQIVESLEHYAGLLELNRGASEEKRTWRTR
ncbi:MAG TPA: DUF4350 domain-containing protein [Candidatus Acidoferrales bacterium]|nr:DUF4350 domain-containing protein [Candidatus Acidoferrales bacterium]